MEDKEAKTKKDGAAIAIYGLISAFLLIGFIFVAYRIVVIKYVEGPEWRKIGQRYTSPVTGEVIAKRGNIYAEDSKLLATSIPKYKVLLDFNAEGVKSDTVAAYIDTLSTLLAENFGNVNPDLPQKYNKNYYKNKLTNANNTAAKEKVAMQKAKRNNTALPKLTCRRVELIPFEVDYIQMSKLKNFPFLKKGKNMSGLYTEERTERLRPFGLLAGRTIGTIYPDQKKGGRSGLEQKYDSILKGVDGVKMLEKVGGTRIGKVVQKPIDGNDIQVTINVDMQDIVEKALYNKLVETKAKSGCAILMEVKTGEIKAISNLDRTSNGGYAEGKPNAFSYMFEPGSTFKAVSLLAALDDGYVTPSTIINAEKGKVKYAGRMITDHDAHKGKDKTHITVAEGIYASSNVVAAKVVLKGYEDDPARFVEKVRSFGLGQNLKWDVPLQGREGTINIRSPKEAGNWYKTTLAWMAFGYETQVPPIYMLMFYNAVANNGKMIKPFLLKSYTENGRIAKQFKAEVIKNNIASKKALDDLKDVLRGVVEEGTAKAVNSSIVSIAGKTGTTKLLENGKYGSNYYVSFVGYFPADNPKYSCYVGIERPSGIPSGGGMSGRVFRDIAEQIYIDETAASPIFPEKDTINMILPKVHNGNIMQARTVLKELHLKNDGDIKSNEWGKATTDENKIYLTEMTEFDKKKMPNVIGMGLKDALFVLESVGLKVKIDGCGMVVSQSISTGTTIKEGTTVLLKLKL